MTEEQNYICQFEDCKFETSCPSRLKRHYRDCHDNGTIWYECGFENCNYKCKRADYIHIHRNRKHGIELPKVIIPDEGEHLPVVGYEGDYEVYEDGRVFSIKVNRFLTPQIDKDGYSRVSLRVDKKGRNYMVHRLVALTFISNPDNKPIVDHIDGDITNNHWSNLRWCSVSQNTTNMRILNRNKSGEKNVSWHKHDLCWRVNICKNGQKIEKRFKVYEEAVAEAKRLREKLHGEFARHQ